MSRVMGSLCACLMMIAQPSFGAEAASCQRIKIGVANWTDVMATSAVASAILQDYGYQTEQIFASEQIILAGLKERKLDFFLGYWKPLMTASVEPMVSRNQIEVSTHPNLTDANATLAVPHYLFEKGLRTFSDIARFKNELGGKIYSIEAGSAINRQIRNMIEANQFGLSGFEVVESSEAGMLSEVRRAESRKEAIVFFGWAPHPMNETMAIDYLTGSHDALGANEGLATVWTLTKTGYGSTCPNVLRLLTNLTFSVASESQMMMSILAGKKPDLVARQWLMDHPDDRRRWTAGVTGFGRDQ